MVMKIVYFTSEFPGQTHIFLWREYQELLRLGIQARIVSTRIPVSGVQSHGWSEQAKRDCFYLYPMSFPDFWRAVRTLFSCSFQGWMRILSVLLRIGDLGVVDRFVLLGHLLLAARMSQFVKREGHTHIHCTTCAATANIAMFCHFLTGTRYSLSLLGPRLETYGSNQANKWRHASFALFQSQKLYRETKEAIPGCIPELHAFAPVGVNTEVVKRSAPYRPWQPGVPCRLYSCGRLHPIKGHEYVIRAVKLLEQRGYPVELLIGGEDIDGGTGFRREVEAEIRRQGLDSKVVLLGAVSEEENIRQYQAAHVYVMGSLDEAAGAVAAMEAMAMEVPVVMPDVGATTELITSGEEGILVPAKSPEALADAIETLLRQPETAVQMGIKGRKKVQEQFNQRLSAAAIAGFLARTQGTA